MRLRKPLRRPQKRSKSRFRSAHHPLSARWMKRFRNLSLKRPTLKTTQKKRRALQRKIKRTTRARRTMRSPLSWNRLTLNRSASFNKKRRNARRSGFSKSRSNSKKRSHSSPGMMSASSPDLIKKPYRNAKSNFFNRRMPHKQRISLLAFWLVRLLLRMPSQLKKLREKMKMKINSHLLKKKLMVVITPTLRS